MPDVRSLRSRQWLDSPELYGWTRRAALKGSGLNAESFENRPIIGICNTWSELTHCNLHLRGLADAVKRGVWQAGGCPLEFPVMSLGEFNMRPTTMLYRNLLSMDVEESIRANPLDGVVLLGGCDKTTPALMMGAASADIPSILVTGGPQLSAHWQGEQLGSCTDCRRYETQWRAGQISDQQWLDLQDHIIRSPGHCMTIGTASTMGLLAEVLGIALPGNGTIPAVDSRRLRLAERAGRQIVANVWADIKPSTVLTAPAFDNAIRVLHAVAGSTNAAIHLMAIAGRLGVELPLDRFDALSRTTPVLLNLKPAGAYLMEDFYYAGGGAALFHQLRPLLYLDTATVTGQPLAVYAGELFDPQQQVIRPLDQPLQSDGGLAILFGSLAPQGAVLKYAAATPRLLQHRGRAVVFGDHDDLRQRIDSDALDVTEESVLVLRNAGPVGAPGMPEWGSIPIPRKLARQGVRDMLRISDARTSGTAAGTVVVHVSPEAAVGGPLAAVRDGDLIELDVRRRRLDLLVAPDELQQRLASAPPAARRPLRGYRQLFHDHILQAHEGCDFDFLRWQEEVRGQ